MLRELVESLDKDELEDLIVAYNNYVISHDDDYIIGWTPVCIHEFYHTDYQLEDEDE